MAKRVTVAFMFGPVGAAAVGVAVVASPGEGIVVGVLDLMLFCLVAGVVASSGLFRGRLNWTNTAPPVPPNPWRLLSLRDRHLVRRSIRVESLPDDEQFVAFASEWVEAVGAKPDLVSPRQRRRADAMGRLLRRGSPRLAQPSGGVQSAVELP
ncbi:MAG TPA: hypothetical protein VG650_03610 [Mycobacteriales bacterium]|nr:hypothetical protein [Mycobacteriales bacterium]